MVTMSLDMEPHTSIPNSTSPIPEAMNFTVPLCTNYKYWELLNVSQQLGVSPFIKNVYHKYEVNNIQMYSINFRFETYTF